MRNYNCYIRLLSLCNLLLEYPSSLENFYKEIESECLENELLNKILDNIEDLIEHIPSKNLLTEKYDLLKYKSCIEYRTMLIDIELLHSILNGEITDINSILHIRYLRIYKLKKNL